MRTGPGTHHHGHRHFSSYLPESFHAAIAARFAPGKPRFSDEQGKLAAYRIPNPLIELKHISCLTRANAGHDGHT